MRLSLGALLVGAVVLGVGVPSSAEPQRVAKGLSLRLRAPVGCPSLSVLRDLVAEHLGDEAARAPDLGVEIAVRRVGTRWFARLDLRGSAGGQRDLEGTSCRELIDAAALVIALAAEEEGHVVGSEPLPMVIEGEPELGGPVEPATSRPSSSFGSRGPRPVAAERARSAPLGPVQLAQPEPEPDPASDPVTALTDSPESPPDYDFDVDRNGGRDGRDDGPDGGGRRAESSDPHGILLALRAGGVGESGVLPGAAAGVEGGLAVGRGRYRLELTAAYWPERSARVTPGAGVLVSLWTSGLRGCRAIGVASLCAGGELGRMSGRGMDLPDPRGGSAWWGALSGSAWLRRPVGRASIYAGLEGLVPVVRPRFELDDQTLLHRPEPVAARALLGVELALH